VIPFTEFIKHFECVDICHYRSSFSYEFETLHLTKQKPAFVRLEIKEDHEAYISIEKVYSDDDAKETVKHLGNHGYTRCIVARETGSQTYEYFVSKLETTYGDMSLRCNFTAGRYLIMIEADYLPDYQKFDLIFSYYFQNLQEKENKSISLVSCDQLAYLRDVFLNHAYRMSADITKLSSRPEDWVKTTLLYEQGGYGYVACSLQKDTNFKLHITIDEQYLCSELGLSSRTDSSC
jgi:hypothetical protein